MYSLTAVWRYVKTCYSHLELNSLVMLQVFLFGEIPVVTHSRGID